MNDAQTLKMMGELVRERRMQLGHSQQDFAVLVGLRAQTVRFFEKGHRWPGDRVQHSIEAGLGWQPGSIERFRRQARDSPSLQAALAALHASPPPQRVTGGG
jgi:DNA-binding XRE family transcriptional regulator